MTNYLSENINKINEMLKSKEITVLDLVMESIDKIKSNNNLVETINETDAIKLAKELDKKEVDNVLFGIPVLVSDLIVTKNLVTKAGSKMLEDFIPIYDASVIKEIKENNMIVVGKVKINEFDNVKTNNEEDILNKNIVPLILSTNNNKVINNTNIKPTIGRVSNYGVIAYSSSLDQISVVGRNPYETSLLLNVISKHDKKDVNTFETKEDFTKLDDKKYKVLNQMSIDLLFVNAYEQIHEIIKVSEVSSNLSRYDGIRYGFKYDTKDINELYSKTRSYGFGDSVKEDILLGTYLLGESHKDDYFHKALKLRKDLKDYYNDLFKSYDVIIGNEKLEIVSTLLGLPLIKTKVNDNSLTVLGNYNEEKTLYSFIEKYKEGC